jgi:hypothetical protein
MQICCLWFRVPVGFLLHYILPLLVHSRQTYHTKHPEICVVCRIRTELFTRETQTLIINPAETISVRLVNIPNFDLSMTHPHCSPINRYGHLIHSDTQHRIQFIQPTSFGLRHGHHHMYTPSRTYEIIYNNPNGLFSFFS